MSGKTGISWADVVWNPTVGCSRVSDGCTNCYAFTSHNRRYRANVRAAAAVMELPRRPAGAAYRQGRRVGADRQLIEKYQRERLAASEDEQPLTIAQWNRRAPSLGTTTPPP